MSWIGSSTRRCFKHCWKLLRLYMKLTNWISMGKYDSLRFKNVSYGQIFDSGQPEMYWVITRNGVVELSEYQTWKMHREEMRTPRFYSQKHLSKKDVSVTGLKNGPLEAYYHGAWKVSASNPVVNTMFLSKKLNFWIKGTSAWHKWAKRVEQFGKMMRRSFMPKMRILGKKCES